MLVHYQQIQIFRTNGKAAGTGSAFRMQIHIQEASQTRIHADLVRNIAPSFHTTEKRIANFRAKKRKKRIKWEILHEYWANKIC